MYREVSPNEIISILTMATKLQKIRWCRVADYLFYNGRNKALLNYTSLFSEAKPPKTIRDVPRADLSMSYYCEYGGAAFCLMNCEQVLSANNPPEQFYNFMVQCDPYDNFGNYSTHENDFQGLLLQLINCVEEQLSAHYFSRFSLNKTMLRLEDEIFNFDPSKEVLLGPPKPTPPYKHSCVIDRDDMYVTLVLVYLEPDDNGIVKENIQHYELKDGERLIDAPPPGNLVKAHWNGSTWEETATPEEIAEWKEEHGF